METILYELSFNYIGLAIWLFFLFVAVTIFFTDKIIGKRTTSKPATPIGTREVSPKVIKICTRIVGGFIAVFALLCLISHSTDYREYQMRLDNEDVFVVEGYVENYHPRSTVEKAPENFEIDGVYFITGVEGESSHTYHTVAQDGGVVTHNGQHLKIKYVTNEFGENVILAICEIK